MDILHCGLSHPFIMMLTGCFSWLVAAMWEKIVPQKQPFTFWMEADHGNQSMTLADKPNGKNAPLEQRKSNLIDINVFKMLLKSISVSVKVRSSTILTQNRTTDFILCRMQPWFLRLGGAFWILRVRVSIRVSVSKLNRKFVVVLVNSFLVP